MNVFIDSCSFLSTRSSPVSYRDVVIVSFFVKCLKKQGCLKIVVLILLFCIKLQQLYG